MTKKLEIYCFLAFNGGLEKMMVTDEGWEFEFDYILGNIFRYTTSSVTYGLLRILYIMILHLAFSALGTSQYIMTLKRNLSSKILMKYGEVRRGNTSFLYHVSNKVMCSTVSSIHFILDLK